MYWRIIGINGLLCDVMQNSLHGAFIIFLRFAALLGFTLTIYAAYAVINKLTL